MTVQLGAFINYAGDSVFPSAKRGYFFLSPGGHENSELSKSLVLHEHSLHCQQDHRVQLLLLGAPTPHMLQFMKRLGLEAQQGQWEGRVLFYNYLLFSSLDFSASPLFKFILKSDLKSRHSLAQTKTHKTCAA